MSWARKRRPCVFHDLRKFPCRPPPRPSKSVCGRGGPAFAWSRGHVLRARRCVLAALPKASSRRARTWCWANGPPINPEEQLRGLVQPPADNLGFLFGNKPGMHGMGQRTQQDAASTILQARVHSMQLARLKPELNRIFVDEMGQDS